METTKTSSGSSCIGWPLRLGNLHLKLKLVFEVEDDQQQPQCGQLEQLLTSIETPSSASAGGDGGGPGSVHHCCAVNQHQNHRRGCSSISTLSSSSSLNTQSTASFFQDKSKSLGKILGWRLPIKQKLPKNSRSELIICSRNSSIRIREHQITPISFRIEDKHSPLSSLSFRIQVSPRTTQRRHHGLDDDNKVNDEIEVMASRQPWIGCFPAVYVSVCYGYSGN